MSTGECVPVTIIDSPALALPVLKVIADDLGIAEGQELNNKEFRLVVKHILAWAKAGQAIENAQLNSKFI